MKAYNPNEIKNIALVGSAGSGKTTLAEAMMYEGGVIPRRGNVSAKNTASDYRPVEQEYGSSVFPAVLYTEWKEQKLNFIDTPGADDFVGGVISALNVADTAVMVVNAVRGVEVGTEIISRHAGKLHKPMIFIVNQLDHEKANFEQTVEHAQASFGKKVVLIDEYDKPMLDVLDTQLETVVDGNKMLLEERNRNVLKGFYSVFKAADEHLQFVFLTGVTKFSQVSVFSGFNQPQDISMDKRYEALCGITQEELDCYFAEPMAEMAGVYHCDTPEMRERLKLQYDGYHFGMRLTDIYNPFSLLNAFSSQMIQDYWFRSGTPSYLVRLLRHTKENLDELTGRYYEPQEFVDYKADVEKPLPMIYQSGYLTIKDYNMRRNTFLLDFPNNEVKNGFLTVVASDYLNPKTSVNAWVQDAVDAFEDGDPDKFRRLLTSFLSSIPYTMRRKENERERERERYFHYTFYLIMRLISVYTVYTEKEQSGGRVDCIVETKDYIYIFEFKLDGTAAEALRQIEEKGYARPYLDDPRKLYRIGVSFSSETGTVEEWEMME